MERQLVQRGLNRLILLPIILSVVFAVVLIWQLTRMLDANDWVLHTTKVLTLSSEAQRHIQFQESALRGYEIIPDTMFLHQFHVEDFEVDTTFELLHITTLDNPPQTRRLDTLMQLYWTWQSSARHSLAEAQTARQLGPAIFVHTDSAILVRSHISESLRSGFHRLAAEEERLYELRTERSRQGTTLLLVLIGIVSVLLGTIVGFGARRQLKRFVDRFTHLIEETRENRDLLETTLLSIDDAVIVTDPNGLIQVMNTRALELTGWVWREAKSRMLETVFHAVRETDRTEIESPSQMIARTKKPMRLKEPVVLLSRIGVEFPIEITAAPVCDSKQIIVAIAIVFRDISELRNNERESERRTAEFRALMENAPDIIIRFTSDLTVIYANPAIEQVFDLSPSAIMGRHFSDIGLARELYEPWQRGVEEVFHSGRESSAEIQHRTIRGLRSYHVRIVPESLERMDAKSGHVQSVIAIGREITELKLTEERLRESEARFRSIIENSQDAFFILRAIRNNKHESTAKIIDFTIDHINSPARALLPMPAGELLGKRLSELVPAPRAEQQIEKYSGILDSGVSTSEEQRAEPTADHDVRWFQMQYIPIGDLLGIMATEITARVRTLHALERSEERFRRIVEHASDAIFSTDKEGRFTYANPFIRELGGYGDMDISQYHFTDLLSADHQERVKRHFFRQYLSKVPSSYIEAPFIRRSGGEQWLAITATLDVEGNDVRGFDCIATDISNRLELERELEAAKSQPKNGTTPKHHPS